MYQVNIPPKGICPSCGKCKDCGSTSNPRPYPYGPFGRGYGSPLWQQQALQGTTQVNDLKTSC